MDIDKGIEVLREMADKDPATKAVFEFFTSRQRTRRHITLRTLTMKMREAGYKHSIQEYARVIKALADAGFGELERDGKGDVKSLTGVNVTIPSLGRAVIEGNKAPSLESVDTRNKYAKVNRRPPPYVVEESRPTISKPLRKTAADVAVFKDRDLTSAEIVNVIVNGKAMPVKIPAGLSLAEFKELLIHLNVLRK